LIRKFIRRLAGMSDVASSALLGTLQLCCAMLFCSFMLLVHTGGLSPSTYGEYRTAVELANSPVGLLLLASLFSVIAEEKSLR
jgi:hypothetical protein